MFNENLSHDIKALAYEKSIDVERVFKALEDALSTAAAQVLQDPRADRDRSSIATNGGVVDLRDQGSRRRRERRSRIRRRSGPSTQARKVEPDRRKSAAASASATSPRKSSTSSTDPHTQIRTYDAQKIDPEVEQGDEVQIPLTKPPEELGRIAAQTAKQVLYQKVREAEREKVYNEFIDKLGELENGYVKRFERGDMIVDLNGKTEGDHPALAAVARRALLAGRSHQGRHRRRAHAAEGTAGRPLAHRSAAAHQALRDGSAGDLRRHRRDQGRRPRARRAREDRRARRASATSIRSAPASA